MSELSEGKSAWLQLQFDLGQSFTFPSVHMCSISLKELDKAKQINALKDSFL